MCNLSGGALSGCVFLTTKNKTEFILKETFLFWIWALPPSPICNSMSNLNEVILVQNLSIYTLWEQKEKQLWIFTVLLFVTFQLLVPGEVKVQGSHVAAVCKNVSVATLFHLGNCDRRRSSNTRWVKRKTQNPPYNCVSICFRFNLRIKISENYEHQTMF